MSFETSHTDLAGGVPETHKLESNPQVREGTVLNVEADVANKMLHEEAVAQIKSDEKRASKIASAIRGGSIGSRFFGGVVKRTLVSVLAGTAMSNVEAAPSSQELSSASSAPGRQEQRAEQKVIEFRGVVSDATWGKFNIEISNFGPKQDGSFGYEYRVVINDQQREVNFFQKMRNGAMYAELDGGEMIEIPSAYGKGRQFLPTLTLVRDGKKIELEIKIQK